jgi:hypothetical protein
MKNILTFIIPVRHPDNAIDWNQIKIKLRETIRSVASQDRDGWKAVIVANDQAELPDFPNGFEVKRVDFPSNQLFKQGDIGKEEFYEACRFDKGRRVLAGMLYAGDMGHVMIVDDDDLVSRHLTSFVGSNSGENGWYIREGYIWNDGGMLMYHYSDFSHLCGTSHIIRADLYKLPSSFNEAEDTYIRHVLGSHIFLHDELDSSGTPLKPLPFFGAVYRTGHTEAHSRSRTILGQFFLKKYLLKAPIELYRRISRLRIKTKQVEDEFFGTGSKL